MMDPSTAADTNSARSDSGNVKGRRALLAKSVISRSSGQRSNGSRRIKLYYLQPLRFWFLVLVYACTVSQCNGGGGGNTSRGLDRGVPRDRGVNNVHMVTGHARPTRHIYPDRRWREDRIDTWGSWSVYSSCTKSCGIGIQKRKRKCYTLAGYNTETDPSLSCSGAEVEYQLCNTKACTVTEGDSRQDACASYNKKHYRGPYYTWTPLKKESVEKGGYSPCALVCQAQNYPYQIITKFSNRVPEGTTCTTNNTDGICINSQCIPVGCDKKLHSTKTYDACAVCGGNNKTCDVISGNISRILNHGYTTVLTIPPRARNIVVADKSSVRAVFALRSDHGIYFVNGRLSSSYPTVYDGVGGTSFLYYRPKYDHSSVEKLEAKGPTNETLYVMMLSPEASRKITLTYQYSIPKQANRRRGSSPRAALKYLPHTVLPVADGNHISRDTSKRKQSANDLKSNNKKDHVTSRIPTTDSQLDEQSNRFNNSISVYLGRNSYPDDRYPGRLHHLPRDVDQHNIYQWKTNAAAHCSVTCNSGVVTAPTRCVRRLDGQDVDDLYCDARIKPSPSNVQCKGEPCDPRWDTGDWESCSTACGDGYQTRSVRCWRLMQPGFDSSVRSDMCRKLPKPTNIRRCTSTDCGPVWELSEWSKCSSKCGRGIQKRAVVCSSKIQSCDLGAKPISFRQCSSGACFNKWVVSKWSTCSGACGVGLEYRRVSCLEPSGSYLEDEFCDQNRKPLSVQACGDKSECPAIWVAQTWGKCSVECGDGLKSRNVVCGEVINDEFKSSNERKCTHLYKPATRSRCRQGVCPAQWFTSEWSKCSKTCGTEGYRVRKVSCYSEDKHSAMCNQTSKPANRETCNIIPCDKPLTTTVTTKQVPAATEEEICVDKEGINCRDVVLRQGCSVTRYRKLCCQSCKSRRVSFNNTTYRNRFQHSAHHHSVRSDSRNNYLDRDSDYVTSVSIRQYKSRGTP